MKSYSLSRSSRLYKFVFGKNEGNLEGLPEPMSDRISLGLFIGFFVFMFVMRPIAYVLFSIMGIMMHFIVFFVDGSYMRGELLTGVEFIKIEPWPTIHGKRASPWFILVALTVAYLFWYVGVAEAVETFLFCGFITGVFWYTKPEDKSPATELAEKLEPVIDEKLHKAYYGQPRFFPALYFVD